MDLFDVVNLEVPTSVNVTLRAREDNERPVLEAARGRLVELVIPNADGSPSAAAPIQQIPPTQEPIAEGHVSPQATLIEESVEEKEEEDPHKLKRKSARGQDEGESSKKVRHEVEVEKPEASAHKP